MINFDLIGYGYSATEPNYEGLFKERFQLKREDTLKGSLVISNLTSADSAVYFCAASHTVMWIDVCLSLKT